MTAIKITFYKGRDKVTQEATLPLKIKYGSYNEPKKMFDDRGFCINAEDACLIEPVEEILFLYRFHWDCTEVFIIASSKEEATSMLLEKYPKAYVEEDQLRYKWSNTSSEEIGIRAMSLAKGIVSSCSH